MYTHAPFCQTQHSEKVWNNARFTASPVPNHPHSSYSGVVLPTKPRGNRSSNIIDNGKQTGKAHMREAFAVAVPNFFDANVRAENDRNSNNQTQDEPARMRAYRIY